MKETTVKKLVFFLILFIFCTGFSSLHAYPDNDLWARLIAGAHIIEKAGIIKNDFLSYTPTHIWYDHEWGASAIFYSVLKYFGQQGLIVLKGLLVFLTLVFCFFTIRERKSENISPYNILYYIFMYAAAISSTGPVIRCLLFTSLFFAISIYILERARNGKNKTLFLLPLLMIFWCNIHGGCLSLPGILCVYALGEFLNEKEYKKYIYTFISCIAVTFINTYGPKYVQFLFEAGTMNRTYITEWLSPFLKNYSNAYIPYKIYLAVISIIAVAALITQKDGYKKTDKTKYLIVLLMTVMSVIKIRYINFYVFTAGTLLYNDVYYVIGNITTAIKNKFNKFDFDKIKTVKEFLVYAAIFLISIPFFASEKKAEITSTNYPRYAIEFIKLNKLSGKLFVNFEFGSYCAYKLYPQNKIVMDGRYEEVYAPSLLIELKNFHMVKNDWDKIIKDFPPDVMIIEKKYPVYDKLVSEGKYTVIFENNLSGVFVPRDKVQDEYIYPETDDKYYNDTIFQTDIDFIKLEK